MDATRDRDRKALSDLAKLAASTTPPPAPSSRRDAMPAPPSPDSSGLIDLQAMMASHPAWLDDAVARAKHNARPPLQAPHTLSPVLAAPRLETMETLAPPRSKAGYYIASGLALAAIGAACVFAWHMKAEHADAQRAAAALQATTTTAPEAANPIPSPNPIPNPSPSPIPNPSPVAAAAAPPAVPAAVPVPADDDDAKGASKHHGKHAKVARHGAHGAAAAEPAADPAPPPAPVAAAPPPAPKPAKLPPPLKDDSPLAAALRAAAGGGDAPKPAPAPAADDEPPAPKAAAVAAPPPPAPARAAASDRPDRPSPSAVTSALTGQLGAARACVASASGASKVRVTFGSEGNVQSVDVSGAAQGDPKMTKCLQSAMAKAHVPPFAQPTYSASANVRPE